jgi:prepilin-type N-terminal cleavage/methylation domain-containing protein
MRGAQGFTLVEVMIAIVVLTVGLLGLVTSSAMATRMIARGQRSAIAATFASQRFERLRTTGCANQAAGADTLLRGSTWVAINNWEFTTAANSTWRILVRSTYKTQQGRTRIAKLETSISCLM